MAEALHESATYQEALQQYEQQMRPLVQAQQKQARSFAAFFLAATPLGLFLQQMLVKVVFRETFRRLLRREFRGPSLSKLHLEHHIL